MWNNERNIQIEITDPLDRSFDAWSTNYSVKLFRSAKKYLKNDTVRVWWVVNGPVEVTPTRYRIIKAEVKADGEIESDSQWSDWVYSKIGQYKSFGNIVKGKYLFIVQALKEDSTFIADSLTFKVK